MTDRLPLVSVIMPVFNTVKYVGEAIESILNQSYKNIELIIVDDGSSDGSAEVINHFNDPRIKYFYQENRGVSSALNKALENVNGEYIARQDSDDVSLTDRISREVEFLNSHPEYGLVGTWSEIIDENGMDYSFHKHPINSSELKYNLLIDSPFVSSSVMFRTECLNKAGKFTIDRKYFDDYNMWSSISRYYAIANIPEVLVRYREVQSSLSRTVSNSQERVMNQRIINLKYYYPAMHDRLLDAWASLGFETVTLESSGDLYKMAEAINIVLGKISNDRERAKLISIVKKRLYLIRLASDSNSNLLYSKIRRFIIVNAAFIKNIT